MPGPGDPALDLTHWADGRPPLEDLTELLGQAEQRAEQAWQTEHGTGR